MLCISSGFFVCLFLLNLLIIHMDKAFVIVVSENVLDAKTIIKEYASMV